MFGGGFADPVASDRVQVRAHDKPPFRPSQAVATDRKIIVARRRTSCQTTVMTLIDALCGASAVMLIPLPMKIELSSFPTTNAAIFGKLRLPISPANGHDRLLHPRRFHGRRSDQQRFRPE